MSSTAQAIANIENAKKSTGPRTEAGKAVSSHNSLKHGLTSETVLLPGEDEVAAARANQNMHRNPECPDRGHHQVMGRCHSADRQLGAELDAVGAPKFGCLCSLNTLGAQLKEKILHKKFGQAPFLVKLRCRSQCDAGGKCMVFG